MQADSYSHLVEIDEGRRTLSIYRLIEGKRYFYTSVELPSSPEKHPEFFKMLGENLILDSPQGRRCMELDG